MTPVEYAAIVAAVAQGLPAVVALLESLGCIVTGCDVELDHGPIPAAGDHMRDARADASARVRGLDRPSIEARLRGDTDEVLATREHPDAADVYESQR